MELISVTAAPQMVFWLNSSNVFGYASKRRSTSRFTRFMLNFQRADKQIDCCRSWMTFSHLIFAYAVTIFNSISNYLKNYLRQTHAHAHTHKHGDRELFFVIVAVAARTRHVINCWSRCSTMFFISNFAFDQLKFEHFWHSRCVFATF